MDPISKIAIKLPEWQELLRIAPMTFIIVSVLLVGVGIGWFFMRSHIQSLRDIIEYFKNKGDK